jgi:purine-binding chemotaxis protein CheW
VPVFDLQRWLGRAPVESTPACVVLLAHGGRLAGLLADAVVGIFSEAPGSLHAAHAVDGLPLPFAGSVRRSDDDGLLSVLSVEALAAMPGVPWVDDPEPQRQHGADPAGAAGAPHEARVQRSLMLLRSGAVGLAIDALAVHATLWEPQVRPSVLARGACRGTVDIRGGLVPAVDLLALCGLGACTGLRRSAVVVRRPEGLVALLVDEIAEMARVGPDAIAPPVRFGLPQPALFSGLFVHPQRGHHMVLDAAALSELEEVRSLARANSQGDTGRAAAAGQAARGGGRGLLTLRAPGELAVPIEQIDEIVPWGTIDAVFGADHPLRRIQVLRGRSVPVLCLARTLGAQPCPAVRSAAVLVVRRGDEALGFGVSELSSIEAASWQRELPDGHGADAARRIAVGVGSGPAERTLELLDLHALADRLLAQGLPLAA